MEIDRANTVSHCKGVRGVSENADESGVTQSNTLIAMPAATVISRILLDNSPLNAEPRSERILKAWNSSRKEMVKKVTVVATALPQSASASA